MPSELTPNQKADVQAFVDAFQNSMNSALEAGAILVRLIDSVGWQIKEHLIENFPGLTIEHLNTFERVGRKQLYHELLISDAPGVRALRKCTFSDQVKFWKEPLAMLLSEGKDVLQVSVLAMTSDQAKQVFKSGRIRTLGEQRAWMEAQKHSPIEASKQRPYIVKRGRVRFYDCELTVSQIAQLLSEASS